MRNPFSKTYEPQELRMFDFLQGIKFFELLKQQELARLLPTMHERKYVRDEVIFFINTKGLSQLANLTSPKPAILKVST